MSDSYVDFEQVNVNWEEDHTRFYGLPAMRQSDQYQHFLIFIGLKWNYKINKSLRSYANQCNQSDENNRSRSQTFEGVRCEFISWIYIVL